MTNEVTVEIKLDADLKASAEKLYQSVGTTFNEVIKLFVKQSVETGEVPRTKKKSAAGMLAAYANPAMIPFEKDAWPEAAVERYARSLR